MKKWAFIRKQNGDVECWRYIDNLKEVSSYWYIMQAIDKYGYDDVMPVVMNSVGGYHSVDTESIIKIVESETEPLLNTKEQFLKNVPQFTCGYIDREGNTYSCSCYGHLDLAEELCTYFHSTSWEEWKHTTRLNAPDEFLIQAGYIKIYDDRKHHYSWEYVTDAAIKKLNELEEKWRKI